MLKLNTKVKINTKSLIYHDLTSSHYISTDVDVIQFFSTFGYKSCRNTSKTLLKLFHSRLFCRQGQDATLSFFIVQFNL